jgi:hypothetical protein
MEHNNRINEIEVADVMEPDFKRARLLKIYILIELSSLVRNAEAAMAQRLDTLGAVTYLSLWS